MHKINDFQDRKSVLCAFYVSKYSIATVEKDENTHMVREHCTNTLTHTQREIESESKRLMCLSGNERFN